MTSLSKQLSVLSDLLYFFREAVTGVPRGEFEPQERAIDDARLHEFWIHFEDFTHEELEKIEAIMESVYGLAQDIPVDEMVKIRKAMGSKLDLELVDKNELMNEL